MSTQLERLDAAIAELQALRSLLEPRPAPQELPAAPLEIRATPRDVRAWLRQNWGRLVVGKTRDAAVRQVMAFCRLSRGHAERLVAEIDRR